MSNQPVRKATLNRRRFIQLGAGMLAMPALSGLDVGRTEAATRARAASNHPAPDPNAILQFGEMQGQDYDPIHLATVEFFQLYAIFDTLVSYTLDGNLIPRLATAWEVSQGRVRLSLRKGVTFQDGTTMDAEAVQYSLNRVLNDPDSAIKSEVPMLASVAVVDSGTVDLMLSSQAPLALLFQLANQAGMIVSPTAVEKAGSSVAFSEAPVGAGPYAIDGAWYPTEKMSVRAWPGYWDKSAQALGGIDFVNVLETARVDALRAGAMDVCCGLTGSDAQALKGSPSIKIATGAGNFIYGLNLNVTIPPLDDVKVRQSIARTR